MSIKSDTCYHIFNRGNNKQLIFFEDANYIYFLRQFKTYVSPHCDTYSYCLMPNHFHFFLKVLDSEAFEKGIKNFFISYSKSVNKKYNRVGSLFQGRYKASEINSSVYYTRIISYIHQNPIEAGLVTDLKNYKYSSYNTYLSNKNSLIKREEILNWFGGISGFIEDHQVMVADRDILK